MTPDTNDVRVRLDAAMSQLDVLMSERNLIDSQISSARGAVTSCLLSLGLAQYSAYDLNASFRKEVARHSCDYDRLIRENLDEYRLLMAKGIVKLSEPKTETTLVVERPRRKEATTQ